jgi:hypothetical protein
VALEEDVVDLREFVVVSERQVERRRQSDVVGTDAGKLLHLGHPIDSIYPWHYDFLPFESCGGFWLFGVDDEDERVVGSVDFVEGLLAIDELEGLGPVEFVPVAHLAQFK